MKKYSVVLLAILGACAAFAEFRKIDTLEGEKWWGASSHMGSQMPFADTKPHDFRTYNNNQGMPLLLSSAGRYVWCEKPFALKFENGVPFVESDAPLEIVKAGSTLKDAYAAACKKHFAPNGKLPSEMFFSLPQYNTWIELMYDQNQEDILKYARAVIANGFPVGVFMVDDNWQKYYGNYDFKPDRFPNPKAMTDELHKDGFKIMLWIAPFVSPDSPEYRDLAKRGYLVKDKKGGVKIVKWWNGFSAMYDITNPKVFDYLQKLLRGCMEKYGIDGFKFDAGDTQFAVDCKFFDKNASPSDYCTKWVELAEDFEFNELRSSWKMAGRGVVQRLRDKHYSWKELGWLIPDMLASGITGHAYACPDMIGGGEFQSFLNVDMTKLDQNLIVRSCQVHALMPMMQFSVAPWRVLDAKHLKICADFANLHKKFGGYILGLAKASAKTGEPIVRPMEYAYPHCGYENVKDQFMLGDKYLVAPVVEPSDFRDVLLPAGEWRDDLGATFKGPAKIRVNAPIERLPYFEKI